MNTSKTLKFKVFVHFCYVCMTILGPSIAHSSSNNNECLEIRSQINSLASKFNAELNLDIGNEWFAVTVDSTTKAQRAAVIFDGSMNKGDRSFRLADPCNHPEPLPSFESWAYVMAHEYAHFILNKDSEEIGHCISVAADSVENRVKSEGLNVHIGKLGQHWHANVDIIAFKLLNHFGVNVRKALLDSSQIAPRISSHDAIAQDWVDRFQSLLNKSDSNFSTSQDLFKAYHFNGLSALAPFVRKHYPSSNFTADLERELVFSNGCHYYNPSLQTNQLMLLVPQAAQTTSENNIETEYSNP